MAQVDENVVVEEYDDNAIVSVPSQEVDQLIKTAEQRVQVIQRLKVAALKMTNKSDWIDQGGKPYLMSAGAEKVGRPFGVKLKIDKSVNGTGFTKETGQDEKGEYYIYTWYGTAKIGESDEIDCVGVCSSRDKFFAIQGGELKPISEVDEPNIKKKAYNNMVVNGITRVLGLRNMTWEEVNQALGDKKGVTQIKYRQKKGGEKDVEGQNKGADLVADIQNLLSQIYGSNTQKKMEALKKVTENPPQSIDGLKNFTNAKLTVIFNKLKQMDSDIMDGMKKSAEQDDMFTEGK